MRRLIMTTVAALGFAAVCAAAIAEPVGLGLPAKLLFGHVAAPSSGTARPVGFYAKGCLAGAVPLPVDGSAWQVMRLSRNRNWGTPRLVDYIEKLAGEAAARDGWPGLLVGDMSMPRGGPMPTGHASHQIGLDVDIWATPMPDHTLSAEEREKMGAISLLVPGRLAVDPKKWDDAYGRLLRRAASYPEVARIFVSAAIKKKLCESVPESADRSWLRKLRPWAGHADHFHVRLDCPAGIAGCVSQPPPPPGDGCGDDLAKWFKPKPKPPPRPKTPKKPGPTKPRPPPQEITLADLPKACADVLNDGLLPGTAEARVIPVPRARPATN